jgi:outer membrane lipoprotein-sorting protein
MFERNTFGYLGSCGNFFLLLALVIVDSPETLGDSNVESVKREIDAYRAREGCAMSMSDFESLMTRFSPIPTRYRSEIWMKLKETQRPSIDLSQLIKLIKSRRDALQSLSQSYVSTTSRYANGVGMPTEYLSVRHVLQRGSLFQEVRRVDLRNDKLLAYNTTSYDGRVLRTVDHSMATPNATISDMSTLNELFFQNNLFYSLMMLDSEKYGFGQSPGMDLVCLLEGQAAVLFEKKVTIDEREYVLVSDGPHRVYLSPDMDYAVARLEVVLPKPSARVRGIVPVSTMLHSLCEAKGFTPSENGFFFPATVVLSVFNEHGHLLQKTETEFTKIEINPKVDKDFFENVIPEDAFVTDGIQGITYFGNSTSINDLLKRVAKSKRQWFWQIASMTTGIILIIIWIIIKYMKHRVYLKARNPE